MIKNKWFCEPNPYRQRYCFFYMRTKNENDQEVIEEWKLGIGNINRISNQNGKSQGTEVQIIRSLIPHIKTWREKNILVITEKEKDFSLLRTRILLLGMDEILLSPINTISLQHLINQYLICRGHETIARWCTFLNISIDNRDEPSLMRQILYRMIGLIPWEEIP